MLTLIAKLIRRFCKRHECYKCPLDDHGFCRISACPCNWYFKGEVSLDYLLEQSEHAVTKN